MFLEKIYQGKNDICHWIAMIVIVVINFPINWNFTAWHHYFSKMLVNQNLNKID
jgi:hypothetical protein